MEEPDDFPVFHFSAETVILEEEGLRAQKHQRR
jgi:hypothetical protein